MSFPRAGWDLGQEEVLPGAILALGRGHQPYHHLSCSHDHAADPRQVDPRAMCREKGSVPGQGLKTPGRLSSLRRT